MPAKTVTIRDNRTGKEHELPIEDGTIRANDLRQIKVSPDDFGLMTYDPGFLATASCRSKITYIDGDKGILEYRGYPIEQLVEDYSHLHVAYLLLLGELPDAAQFQDWTDQIQEQAGLPSQIEKVIQELPVEAYPMGALAAGVAALSMFYPDGLQVESEKVRRLQIHRLIAKVPALVACVYRRLKDEAFVPPQDGLSYAANLLHMMFSQPGTGYEVDPILEQALDTLFILHADHEQNCSTSAMRSVGSSGADPYSAAAAAIGALSGPSHGGANEAVIRMLESIGSKEQVAEHIRRVKIGEFRLMGFGHRVYKNYDPRAKIIKLLADQVFEITGSSPLLDIALKLEEIALEDDYFVSRALYPNVDFYSGLIYQAIGFPPSMFTTLFALGRMAGWLAQWDEMQRDPELKIARPRQIFQGYARRDVPSKESASISS